MSELRATPTPPEPEAPQRKPFDQAVADELKEAILGVLVRHPEVRSVAVAIDYKGRLNDAPINHGIWIGEGGRVERPDAVFGSLFQTLKLLEEMFARALALGSGLRDAVTALMAEVKRHDEEIQQGRPQAGPAGPGRADTGA